MRLGEAARVERLAAGWSTFEPMAGRPMREYVVIPSDLARDPEQARAWVERAAEYVRSLPPKASKARKK